MMLAGAAGSGFLPGGDFALPGLQTHQYQPLICNPQACASEAPPGITPRYNVCHFFAGFHCLKARDDTHSMPWLRR